MDGKPADDWEEELERWLEPFLGRLRRQAQRRWAPVYLEGLLLPGERKSVEPMAARVAPGDVQQLHHFVSTSPWATAPLEAELVKAADRLVGGPDAVLVADDAALVKPGRHSVGVKRQYCGQLGKRANSDVRCQRCRTQLSAPRIARGRGCVERLRSAGGRAVRTTVGRL
jgi:SRSO17 transposase